MRNWIRTEERVGRYWVWARGEERCVAGEPQPDSTGRLSWEYWLWSVDPVTGEELEGEWIDGAPSGWTERR